MERYEAYKDSGVEWIGEIPESWSIARSGHFIRLHSGEPLDSLLLDDENSIPVYGGGGIKGYYLESNISAGSVIVSRQGATCGTTRYITTDAWATEHALIVYPQQLLDMRWIAYWLETEQLGQYSMTSAQPGISAQLVESMPMLVLDMEAQQAIADYLDAKTAEIDALVADCEREVELLQEYRKAVISEAVTKGLDPDVPMKDSGIEWIGEIPSNWDAGKLLRHARLESGHTPSKLHPEWWVEEECTIPWVTTQDVHRFRDGRITSIHDTELHVSQIGLDNSSARWLPAGTVALSRTASVGFSIVLSVPMASSQDYADWVPDKDLDSYYLLYSLRSMDMVFKQLQMGSTHKTIYMPDIMKLAIAYPPLEEQRRIVRYLDGKTAEIDSLIDAKQTMVDKLREYRKSLISEAVTGKFKVPGVV